MQKWNFVLNSHLERKRSRLMEPNGAHKRAIFLRMIPQANLNVNNPKNFLFVVISYTL